MREQQGRQAKEVWYHSRRSIKRCFAIQYPIKPVVLSNVNRISIPHSLSESDDSGSLT